jgi:penicillin-binding protein 2
MRTLILVVFLVLGLKLWHLTVVRYDHYHQLATSNRIRALPLVAPRGLLVDREGRVMADSVSAFNLLLFRDEAQDMSLTVDFLTAGLEIDPSQLRKRIEAAADYSKVQPVLLEDNLSMNKLAYLLARSSEHPELRITEQPKRRYPQGEVACHVLGLVGEVSREELTTREFESNKAGDIIGKTGIERSYNGHLTGRDGVRRVLVDSRGKIVHSIFRNEPTTGETLRLTIDLDLQELAEDELEESPGAVVALNPNSGEILALASRPGFDPNLFASRIKAAEWKKLINDPDRPFQNRAIQSVFPPGSIFKVIIALAGLEYGIIDRYSSVYCRGAVNLYGHRFRCWKSGGHGHVRLREAVRQSCNVYFYLLGQKLGIDRIASFSKRLGLGQPTGIDLRGEASGVVPSKEWKQRKFGQPWYSGETISVAIGQGPISVTPMQLARAIGILATGRSPALYLTKDRGEQAAEKQPTLALGFSEEHMFLIREAMWSVVNEWGTGRAARVAGFDVCGKTGTVQVISQQTRSQLPEAERSKFEPNAWFVGFAPREKPEIVVAVMIQRGGSGGSAAAPVAGRLFQRFYEKKTGADHQGLELALHN